MEHLSGTEVQATLSLKEGKGFHGIARPTTIVATLNGQSLETGCFDADPQPSYSTDLVWKMDKNQLRKMRTQREPLKIECFEMESDGTREKIGRVLLCLRTARIIAPKDADIDAPTIWHKLTNLRNDSKIQRPEILLALTIEEPTAYVRRISRKEAKEKHDNEEASIVSRSCSTIQLGCDSASRRDILSLEITAGVAQNLHLFAENDARRDGDGNYNLWCRILDNAVCLGAFASLDRRIDVNKKKTIKIRGSPTILHNYFERGRNFELTLRRSDGRILGRSEADIRSLVCSASANEGDVPVRAIERRCVLTGDGKMPRCIGDCVENEAFLDLRFRLYRADTAFRDVHEIDSRENPCENFDGPIDDRRTIDRCRCAARNAGGRPKSVEAYRRYCLNVNFMGIKLSFSIENVEFRFHHPKAEITSTVNPKIPLAANEKLALQDIGCKFHFISSTEGIRRLLLSFPPRISVSDATGDAKISSGETILDVDHLFTCDKHETRYEATLHDRLGRNPIGTIDVSMRLEDRGPCYEAHGRVPSTSENFGPPIMDDGLMYKIVEELEIWKEHQQELFLDELKLKEECHLANLSNEWQKRRENLESKLACSVEQCKMLADRLNAATEDLRTRRLKSLEKEARLAKSNEELRWRYENYLQELRDASRRTQNEHVAKIGILEEQKNKAETEIEPLRRELERLERTTREQANEIQAFRKGALTQDQTATLLRDVKALEEKLACVQKSKCFFKEQWGKAVREIHRTKMENQRAIQVQIKESKNELKNLDLEEILCADSSSLTNDRAMLHEIQREIDIMRPKSESSRSQLCGGKSLGSARLAEMSDQRDERLKKLVAERDSLLRTGSYTIDDPIITKLNAEIRFHLASHGRSEFLFNERNMTK